MLRRIFALSVLILFLEMLLVRWIGTEIRVFAYLQNGVLVAAFLGLGLGLRNAREPARLLPAAGALLIIAAIIRDPFHWAISEALSQGLTAFQDSAIWGTSISAWKFGGDVGYVRIALVTFSLLGTFVILIAVAWSFLPFGQWLGRWLDEHPKPIVAYTANIGGSIVGIALFDLLTLARTPPSLWLFLVAVGFAATALGSEESRFRRAAGIACAAGVVVLGWPHGHSANTTWSPYQKLTRWELFPPCGESMRVNDDFFQLMLNLDPDFMREHPEWYPPGEVDFSHYILPHHIVGPRSRVLVVGSGTGNDVAAALRAGASSVHAVEIDPVIVSWGRDHHPNHPYRDPRVEVTVDDARAFFRRDRGPYDLIWFGLLDSHTTASAYTNVRLDHFVYTRESFADMKRLLAPEGVVVLFFEPQKPWITDRLAGLLTETFGTRPLVAQVGQRKYACLGFGGLLLIAGSPQALQPLAARAAANPRFAAQMLSAADLPLSTELTTDDWPYLYLQTQSIPKYHLLVAALVLLMGIRLRRRLFRSGESLEIPMALLGIGFMLLEIVGVSRAALLFGTTWTVNAYVVAAILLATLLANGIAARFSPLRLEIPFAGLTLTLLLLAAVPIGWLAALPTSVRVVAGGAFLSLPVVFSGLLFVSLWASRARKDLALGSNLLGSLTGGVVSMFSMLFGFRALTLLTLAVYLAAYLLIRRGARPASQPATRTAARSN